MKTFVAVRRNGYIDVDPDDQPVATAAAVVATAIVVGSVANTLPPACTQISGAEAR
jgi:hypothetical protein